APRPFAGWDAERVAAALDAAVDGLATAQAARCRGTPAAGRDDGGSCLALRASALDAAIPALSASPAVDAPWPPVRAISRCDAAPAPDPEVLRGELARATTVQARAIADAARAAGDDRRATDAASAAELAQIAADALEVAGQGALAAGDATAATSEFESMAMI